MSNNENENERKIDFGVEHTQGSGVVLFRLYTEAAREWVSENLATEGWQWLSNNAFAVDWRYAEPIMAMMDDAGLVIE